MTTMKEQLSKIQETQAEHGVILGRLDEKSEQTLKRMDRIDGRVTWLERRDFFGSLITGLLALVGIFR